MTFYCCCWLRSATLPQGGSSTYEPPWQRLPSPGTLTPLTQLKRALLCSTSFHPHPHPAAGAVQCHPLIYGAIKISAAQAAAKSPDSSAWELLYYTDWLEFHCLPGPSDTGTSEHYPSALSSNNSEFLGKQKCNTSGWKRFLYRKLLHLTEIDGIAFCLFLHFYLQGRSPPTVLWERPTANNREQPKLNTPNATLVLHFRLQKSLGWPVQETDLNPKYKPRVKVQKTSEVLGAQCSRHPKTS